MANAVGLQMRAPSIDGRAVLCTRDPAAFPTCAGKKAFRGKLKNLWRDAGLDGAFPSRAGKHWRLAAEAEKEAGTVLFTRGAWFSRFSSWEG